ncbi:hypothetical protein PQX77_008647, partial [Marasmius sp. AFHP31]
MESPPGLSRSRVPLAPSPVPSDDSIYGQRPGHRGVSLHRPTSPRALDDPMLGTLNELRDKINELAASIERLENLVAQNNNVLNSVQETEKRIQESTSSLLGLVQVIGPFVQNLKMFSNDH